MNNIMLFPQNFVTKIILQGDFYIMNIELLIASIMLHTTTYEKVTESDMDEVVTYYATVSGINPVKASRIINRFFSNNHIEPTDWLAEELPTVIQISQIKDFDVKPFVSSDGYQQFTCVNEINIEYLRRAIKYCQENIFNGIEANIYNGLWFAESKYRDMTVRVYTNYDLMNNPTMTTSIEDTYATKAAQSSASYRYEFIKHYLGQFFTDIQAVSANTVLYLIDRQLEHESQLVADINFDALLNILKRRAKYVESLDAIISDNSLDNLIQNYTTINYMEREYVNRAYLPIKNALELFFGLAGDNITYAQAIHLVYAKQNQTGLFAPIYCK